MRANKLLTSEDLINSLITKIHLDFQVLPKLEENEGIAYADGDDWSVQKIIEILNYRKWDEITFTDFVNCGASELKSYLSPKAFSYYLPGLLSSILKTICEGQPVTRLHETVFLMIMPTNPAFSAVWEYFGEGLFENYGTPHFMKSTSILIKKIDFFYRAHNSQQRECVAQFIELASAYRVDNPDLAFKEVVAKYADFWRSKSVN